MQRGGEEANPLTRTRLHVLGNGRDIHIQRRDLMEEERGTNLCTIAGKCQWRRKKIAGNPMARAATAESTNSRDQHNTKGRNEAQGSETNDELQPQGVRKRRFRLLPLINSAPSPALPVSPSLSSLSHSSLYPRERRRNRKQRGEGGRRGGLTKKVGDVRRDSLEPEEG